MAIQAGGPLTLEELNEINTSLVSGKSMSMIAGEKGVGQAVLSRRVMQSGVFPAGVLAPVGRPLMLKALGAVWMAVLQAERGGWVDELTGMVQKMVDSHENAV